MPIKFEKRLKSVLFSLNFEQEGKVKHPCYNKYGDLLKIFIYTV